MAPFRWGSSATDRGGDVGASATLAAIILIAVGFRFKYDDWLAEWDILDFFLPSYGYVGDRIRAFEVPAWNPHFSSGTPMAGDAGGGWMYLPVMLAFSLFSVAIGMKVMVLVQAALGGAATYLLGRRLGLVPLAALFAATTFAAGPALYDATGQSTVIGQISAFIPVGLVAADCALYASCWCSRLAWSGVAAVALVQMFAAWPQGFVYGAMLVGAWLAYRALFAPVHRMRSRRAGLGHMLVSGLATAGLAAAFGAAAILPRLDFSAQSTIPNGDYSNVVGGEYIASPLPRIEILGLFLQNAGYWRIIELSSVVLILAMLAVLLGRARYGIPFFAVATLVFIDLAATHSVTRAAFSLVPMFERVHGHRPTASMYMVFLPLAMLAGAGVQLVLTQPDHGKAWLRKLIPLPVVLLALLAVEADGHGVDWQQPLMAIAATVLIVVSPTWLPVALRGARESVPRMAAIGLLGVSLVYPSGVDFAHMMQRPEDLPGLSGPLGGDEESVHRALQTVLARIDPGAAADVLQRFQSNQPPFRYATYFGTGTTGTAYLPSTQLRLEPSMVAILASARAARLGLEQISGYNPLHLGHYVEYFEAMNAARQDYHWLDVYAAAVSGSQLLDMLNVRFVLVPTALSPAAPIGAFATPVYRDDLVTVYENPRAFSRAWLVHDVRPNTSGQGLAQLADNSVDGHSVAFVDGPVPPASEPVIRPDPTSSPDDRVVVTSVLPETIDVRSTSDAAGLLVVSEPYADGWNAYVDGHPVNVLRTDQALQGVPLAAGDHSVVLKYEPRSLALGLWITAVATLVLLGLWLWALATWVGSRRSQ